MYRTIKQFKYFFLDPTTAKLNQILGYYEHLLKILQSKIGTKRNAHIRKEYKEQYTFLLCNLRYLKQVIGIRNLPDSKLSPNHFWKQLQLVIGTEEDVHIRREVNDIYMYALNSSYHTCEYMSGSKGEGFRFSWSDIDVMGSDLTYNISMESLNNECNYVATRSGCEPGFCQILEMPNGDRNAQCYFLSRIKFIQSIQQQHFNKNVDHTNRGPCLSTKYPKGFDWCRALPLHIDSSKKFLKNFHTKFWNSVKSKIINDRITVMHCVPKGPERGDDEGRQWLISFSVLEQKIVHSLNHVQFCCYGLMKILIHSALDLSVDTNDTISSYHIKTVLFHVLEDILPSFWIPLNIFHCVRICLTRLLLYLLRGHCPSYFVPENNLFLKSKIVQKRSKIQQCIHKVFLCKKTFLSCVLYIHYPADVMELQYKSHSLREFYSLCLALNLVKGYQTTYRQCIHSVLKIMLALQVENHPRRIAILKYTWVLIMRRIGVILYDKFVLTGNALYLLSAEVALMFAQNANVFGSVYLATLWYCRGRYKQCLRLLKKVKVNTPPLFFNSVVYTESLKLECKKVRCDYSFLIKHHYRKLHVDLHKTSHLFPKDLEDCIETCKISEFLVFDKCYAFFLLFLCYHDMHKRTYCSQMLMGLQKSLSECQRLSSSDDLLTQNTKRLIDIAETKMKNI